MPKIVITGGLGFIGSAFLRRMDLDIHDVICVDAMTYAADERRLPDGLRSRIRNVALDVADPSLRGFIKNERPDWIVHFAAESHVTRSEDAEEVFFRTNVEGTRNVLEAAEVAGATRVVHVSTDEVYGSASTDPFREDQKDPGEGRATSAYARSKAVADDVAMSFGDRLAVTTVRPTNCFGPWQHPEKAIARWTTRALMGMEIPVWGDGNHVRDWMFVDDACSAISLLIEKGEPGEVYNIAPEGDPVTNLEVARLLAEAAGRDLSCIYLTSYDRPLHDRRYAIDSTKLRALGWRPTKSVRDALKETVQWYEANEWWWRPLLREAEGLYRDGLRRGDSDTEGLKG